MTDQDRGAYAPQADAPLSFETFDARSRTRRPMPMTLIGSVVVLAVLGAAAFMFYRSGSHEAVPQPVGAAVGPIKSAAAASAQPRDPGAGLDVYSPQNVPTSAPKPPAFAAAPEQPLPRPAPRPAPTVAAAPAAAAPGLNVEAVRPAPVHAAPAPKPAPPVTAKPLVAKATTTTAARPVEVATTTTTTKTAVAVQPAKPAPIKAKPVVVATATAAEADDDAPAPKAALPAAGAGGVAVQIGAFSSASLADKGYGDVAAKMSGRMSGHSKAVEPLARDGKTLYRTSVRGFAGRADAVSFCEALRAKGATCIVKG